ncbi:hypothetical protein [Haladaptatus pallidirubidus]|nr:hypothetical protein [Haladaptatus pallidirubidus]
MTMVDDTGIRPAPRGCALCILAGFVRAGLYRLIGARSDGTRGAKNI